MTKFRELNVLFLIKPPIPIISFRFTYLCKKLGEIEYAIEC